MSAAKALYRQEGNSRSTASERRIKRIPAYPLSLFHASGWIPASFGIAWSVASRLACSVGSRTLFATHFHELTELEARLPGRVCNYHTTAELTGERLTLLYQIQKGKLSELVDRTDRFSPLIDSCDLTHDDLQVPATVASV